MRDVCMEKESERAGGLAMREEGAAIVSLPRRGGHRATPAGARSLAVQAGRCTTP